MRTDRGFYRSHKKFLLFLVSQTVSQMGSAMTGLAVVIWAYSGTGQVMASSLLAVCSTLPYLIVSLFGGAAADHMNKKKIMLICDMAAAAGSLILLLCASFQILELWILCVVNVINGLMNAFQGPAFQVSVTLLLEKENYAKAGGLQSALGAVSGLLSPILAAALLGFSGLQLVLAVDLATFAFAFFVLLLFIRIPDRAGEGAGTGSDGLRKSMKTAVDYLRGQKSILLLLIMYSVLEFLGAISFDSMYSPLLLARTGNNESVVGIVSSVIFRAISIKRMFSSRTDQAVLVKSDQVCSASLCECFLHQIIIFRVPVLDQRPLHRFFMWIDSDINRFHRAWIQSGIIHTG